MWRIKGITDEAHTCDVCGRTHLKKVIYLVTDEGDELYAGTTCAARKVGVTAGRMRGAVKSYYTRLEIARCEFLEYFRRIHKCSVGTFLNRHPDAETRRRLEKEYRRYMLAEGFNV